jgi:hypothetical protein
LSEEGESEGVTRFSVAHAVGAFRVGFKTRERCRLLRFPVETVSLAESGVERIVQGSRLFLLWPLRSGGRDSRGALEVKLET